MYQQREKYNKISLLALGCTIIFCFLALIKSAYLLILLSLYSLTVSLFSEAMMLLLLQRQTDAIKQFIRAFVLFVLTTFLFITFLKGL